MIARFLGMTAALSLAIAPLAAQAGTRAPAADVPFDGLTPVHHLLNEDDLEAGGWLFGDVPPALLIALASGLFLGGILLLTGGDNTPENNASSGTGG